jgi:peptidoglycan hydrolase CwlO-like protein
MMDILRLIGMVVLAALFAIIFYSWMACEKERENLKKLLKEEQKKLRSEMENCERAERKFSAANRLIEKLKVQIENLRGQNKDLEARLTKLWQDASRLKKPTGVGPKKSSGDL